MTLIAVNTNELKKLVSNPHLKEVYKFSDIFPGNITPLSSGLCGLYLKNNIAVVLTGTTFKDLQSKKDLLDHFFKLNLT